MLWSAPRSRSTAFFRMMAQRGCLDVAGHPVLSAYLDYHLPYYEALHARRLLLLSRRCYRAGPGC